MRGEGVRSCFRARFYDASIGRWISQDPIGFEAGDSNLYRYARNKPVNTLDPSGLQGLNYRIVDQDLVIWNVSIKANAGVIFKNPKEDFKVILHPSVGKNKFGSGPNKTIATLRLVYTRKNNTPLEIKFEQEVKANDDSGIAGGLRLNLVLEATNNMKTKWMANELELKDDTPATGQAPKVNHKRHPAWPHFHPEAADTKANFYSPYSTVKAIGTKLDPSKRLRFSGGATVNKGKEFTVTNLLIHERNFLPKHLTGTTGRRTFRLIETPVPLKIMPRADCDPPVGLDL